VSLYLWHVASDPPPDWLGEVTESEVDRLRRWAEGLRIHELWFSAESQTLAGNEGVLVCVRPGENLKETFVRLLRREEERQSAQRQQARDWRTEAGESLRRFQGPKGKPKA
jgi:hypothetical protein